MSPAGPEDKARETIDRLLTAAGWHVCDYGSHGISKPFSIREFLLKPGHGHADYLLDLHGNAVGTCFPVPCLVAAALTAGGGA